MVSLAKGHDINYFTEATHGGKGACAGAMGYYTEASGEPPGQWAGRGAASLGLGGLVDSDVIRKLYMEGIGPDGERLVRRPGGQKDAEDAAEQAVRAFRKAHPYASATEADEKRTREKAKALPKSVPYFDLTVSAVKSVSVLHASYRIAAIQARARGADDDAVQLDARADAIEQAVLDAARDAVRWLERHAMYTRTGYHSKTTGEWRDGAGLAAALFPHHLSRDGDPQLHVHIAIWNRVQRGDGVDDKWRTLFGRALYANRIGLAPVPDRFLEKRMRDLGYLMEQREDRNGCEVAGVSERVMKRFSSRRVAVAGELARLAAEWERVKGSPPSQRTLYLLAQQANQNTRRTKAQSRRTAGGVVHDADLDPMQRMAEWEEQTAREEMTVLSLVHQYAEQRAREAARERARGGAPAGADDGADGGADPVVLPLEPVPDAVLSEEDKRRTARIAVARVQERHAAWSMAELRWEVHRALGPGVSADDVTEIAALAVSGRCGAAVVQVGDAPDVTDVTPLGIRASDGGSVYRPPGTQLWCTVEHLDLEEHIVAVARRQVRQRVTDEEARVAVALTDLTDEQAAAVIALLTATTMTVPLNAAAGSGKTHTMAAFAKLWTQFTGGRVIGLTTSTNAARVLAGEAAEAGAPLEAYNIAQFLGKVKDSDELRWPVPIGDGDVLIVDEATQVSTADYALIEQAARDAGAFVHPVGDTEQLGAVDAGGIFQLLAESIDGPRMTEILRFRHRWEADASLRVRAGDVGGLAAYDRRGRIRGDDHDAAYDQAARLYLSDLLRNRDALLLAGSSAEAAELARRVQALLRAIGRVAEPETDLGDGNQAGVGDLIRARLNSHIDAGGELLTNRDTLRVVRFETELDGAAGAAWVQRRTGRDPQSGEVMWSPRFRVPAAYLAESAELDYAGNAHVAQGRTVTAGTVLVSQTLSRRGLYVGLTRGREQNTAIVVTGNTAPAGKPAYEQATVESVLAGVMEREAPELSATAHMRAGMEWAHGAGHVLHLWSVAVRETLYPAIDKMVTDRLTADHARRYRTDFARAALHARLREAQLAGHDIRELINRITADALGGARTVAGVLHSRLRGLGLEGAHDVSWAQRTPDGVPDLAVELAEGLDARQRELGTRLAENPEPWVARHLGTGSLAAGASPALRAEWERRAGLAAGYREAAGITDPAVSAAVMPHEGNPELETYRRAAMAALEIRDESEVLASMSLGQLEALVADGDHAVARAPANATNDLRLTGRAKADAWAQSATAQAEGNTAAADSAAALARQLEADETRLEPDVARYEQWSSASAETRDWASKARAELDRRGWQPEDDARPSPQPLADWWRDLQAGDAEPGAAPAAAPGPGAPARQLDLGFDDPEPSAAPEPGSLVAWWRQVEADRDAAPGPVPSAAEAAGGDTPAGPGPASGADADPPQPDAADAPRAAGPASPRGAQPGPAASAEPEHDDAWYAAQHDRLDAEREQVWRDWAARHDAAAAAPRPDPEAAPGPGEPARQPELGFDVPAAGRGREAELNTRLDDLQVKAGQAAAAAEAGRQARSDYAARQRQAETEAETEAQAGSGWAAGIETDEEMEPG